MSDHRPFYFRAPEFQANVIRLWPRPFAFCAAFLQGIKAMTYSVKEIFYTLQGEGSHTGRPAVFCRFAGCNLWTGRERDRATAICTFCDTDFVGVGPDGGKFRSADELADAVARQWPSLNGHGKRFAVSTGGAPWLQLDDAAIAALHERGFEVAIETNGTLEPPQGIDWVCVS